MAQILSFVESFPKVKLDHRLAGPQEEDAILKKGYIQ